MVTFKHIEHVKREIYNRTFMNEINLFFTYNPIDISEVSENFNFLLPTFNGKMVSKEDNMFIYKHKSNLITFTPNGVYVSIPAKEYKDFKTTSDIWDNLGLVLKALEICPNMFLFTKGNLFIFNKPIADE